MLPNSSTTIIDRLKNEGSCMQKEELLNIKLRNITIKNVI